MKFELTIEDRSKDIGPQSIPKRLKLVLRENGFNLLDGKGFCIIEAFDIAESGEFGVNIDLCNAQTTARSKSEACYHDVRKKRYQFYLTEAD